MFTNNYSQNISLKNPEKNNTDLIECIYSYNTSQKKDDLDEIIEKIKSLNILNNFKDEFINLISDSSKRQDLRKTLGLIKEKDIVCEKSQGYFTGGQNACSPIALRAIEWLSICSITEPEQIYEIIQSGINDYQEKKYIGKPKLDDVLKEFALSHVVEMIVPNHKSWPLDESQTWYLEMMEEDPLSFPLIGKPQEDFHKVLNFLSEESQKRLNSIFGCIVCNGETVVVHFSKTGKPLLFDSHAREYNGMDKGASLLQFNSVSNLADHLKNKVFAKTKEDFQMFIPSLHEDIQEGVQNSLIQNQSHEDDDQDDFEIIEGEPIVNSSNSEPSNNSSIYNLGMAAINYSNTTYQYLRKAWSHYRR